MGITYLDHVIHSSAEQRFEVIMTRIQIFITRLCMLFFPVRRPAWYWDKNTE